MSESCIALDWLCHTTLTDGTPVVMRPLRAEDSSNLVQGLQGLSIEARYQRFLYVKHAFTANELDYLTACDGINHLAIGLALSDENGSELQPIAVARWIRDEANPLMAEVAVVVADTWQVKGAGKILFQALAEHAWKVGIRRWQALLLNNNAAAFRLMEMVGTKQSQSAQGTGATLVTYTLYPPAEIATTQALSRADTGRGRSWLTIAAGAGLLCMLVLFAARQISQRKVLEE